MGKKRDNESVFTPVSESNRIDYMDLIRGLAIFGILIVNLRWFSLYSPDVIGRFHFPVADGIVRMLQNVLIEGKFYSIFSLLFGWGIALQISRSTKDDKSTAHFIRRRLFFMLLLGGIHLFLIWEGDIVFLYGLVGFVLLSLRHFSNRTLFISGAFLLLSPALLYFLKMNYPWLNFPSEMLSHWGEKIYQHYGWVDQDTSRTEVLRKAKSWSTVIQITLGDAPYRFAYLFFVSRLPKVLGAMLIGFVIGRTNFYSQLAKHKRMMLYLSLAGLLVFIPLNYLLMVYMQDDAAFQVMSMKGLSYSLLYALCVFPLAIVFMMVVFLLYEVRIIHCILKPVLAVGKMAFSNYLMQSVVGIFIFYGIGFGFMEQLGPLAWSILGIILFAIQIILSNIWLSYFKFGPVEWLWRSLTYKKMQPFKVQ